jgi:hypothetical protein
MSSNYKTKSFKIPKVLELEMQKKIISSGYGLRGKSKWICAMIVSFLNFPDDEFIFDSIDYIEELDNLDKSMSFRPTEEVDKLLREWLIKARTYNPTIEGVKSKIIRAAIMNALINSIESLNHLKVIQTTIKT